VEVVLVDYDGSQQPKTKPAAGPTDNKSSADSSPSEVAKEANPAPAESNKGAGSNDKDEVFSDSEGEDGSSKGRREKDANAQGSANAAKPSETSIVQEASAAASRIEKVAITNEQGTAEGSDPTSLKTEVSNKSSSAMTPAPPVESSGMSEFKAIAADASVFSFGDEDDYESE
jgi:phosphatidylinositol-3,4,5-trisphosphate 3-phosphatase and dual-specificity protein phosphatase PTEN